MNVTCETPGCDNEGITIEVADTWLDVGGIERPSEIARCGRCNEWIIPPPTEGESHAPDPV